MPQTNEDLQKDVLNAIKWEPLLNAAEVGVTAKDGVVTLTGVVDSYAKKLEAETAAKNVVGVKAVVEAIEIKFVGFGKKPDSEIATDVIAALKWNWQFSSSKIKIKVENAWVTLEGELTWNYQREAAKNAIIHVSGIRGVNNEIKLKSETQAEVEKNTIEQALIRSSSVNAKEIQIQVKGNKVTLTGKVHSLTQKNEAERIAWAAPGVESIDNQLDIRYTDELVSSFI
ncbi:MAG: BON domain-containing protein [Bacteroidia bacterium]